MARPSSSRPAAPTSATRRQGALRVGPGTAQVAGAALALSPLVELGARPLTTAVIAGTGAVPVPDLLRFRGRGP